jgi:hypothetical protein
MKTSNQVPANEQIFLNELYNEYFPETYPHDLFLDEYDSEDYYWATYPFVPSYDELFLND